MTIVLKCVSVVLRFLGVLVLLKADQVYQSVGLFMLLFGAFFETFCTTCIQIDLSDAIKSFRENAFDFSHFKQDTQYRLWNLENKEDDEQ